MLYTIPDYYQNFKCTADECEDTCCAGWQIAIDRKSLGRYGKVSGKFRRRLNRSIRWLEGTFKQGESTETTTKLELSYIKITRGSVVVLETKQNYLFTGNAIGSGCGVWMQVPGGTSLEEYYDGLVGLMAWLVKKGGRMKFFGGHHTQVFESTAHPVYNPLSLGVLADLIDLVDQVIHGENLGRPSNAKPFSKEQVRYASYGRAEMQYCASRIHRK